MKFNLSYSNSINSIEKGFIKISNDIYYLSFGRFNQSLSNESKTLSSGSLIMSNNVTPIPMIDIGIEDYKSLTLFQFNFQYKGGLSHGWLNKGHYLKSPFLHQKNNFLDKLLECTFCCGFHSGILVWGIWYLGRITQGDAVVETISPIADPLLMGFASAAFSYFVDTIIGWMEAGTVEEVMEEGEEIH